MEISTRRKRRSLLRNILGCAEGVRQICRRNRIFGEPRQDKAKRETKVDPLTKRPALAVAYHVPERNTPEYYAMILLDQILIEGDDSLLHQELVQKRGYTGGVEGGINLLGSPYNYQGTDVVYRGRALRPVDEAR